jgi:hypothetical protein
MHTHHSDQSRNILGSPGKDLVAAETARRALVSPSTNAGRGGWKFMYVIPSSFSSQIRELMSSGEKIA